MSQTFTDTTTNSGLPERQSRSGTANGSFACSACSGAWAFAGACAIACGVRSTKPINTMRLTRIKLGRRLGWNAILFSLGRKLGGVRQERHPARVRPKLKFSGHCCGIQTTRSNSRVFLSGIPAHLPHVPQAEKEAFGLGGTDPEQLGWHRPRATCRGLGVVKGQ